MYMYMYFSGLNCFLLLLLLTCIIIINFFHYHAVHFTDATVRAITSTTAIAIYF